jgi:hypothetical protein
VSVAEDMSAVRYRVPAFSLAVAGAAAVRCPFGSVVRERRADPAAVVEDLSGSPAVRARSGVHALIRRWVGVPGGCRRDRDWVPEHRTAARRYRADISPQGGPRTESAIRAHHRPPASAAGDRRRRAHMCRTECRRRGLLDPPRTASPRLSTERVRVGWRGQVEGAEAVDRQSSWMGCGSCPPPRRLGSLRCSRWGDAGLYVQCRWTRRGGCRPVAAGRGSRGSRFGRGHRSGVRNCVS